MAFYEDNNLFFFLVRCLVKEPTQISQEKPPKLWSEKQLKVIDLFKEVLSTH